MFRKRNLSVDTACELVRDVALRHPDGSIDFQAYRERARLARAEAIKSTAKAALSLIATAFSGKPAPEPRHRAT